METMLALVKARCSLLIFSKPNSVEKLSRARVVPMKALSSVSGTSQSDSLWRDVLDADLHPIIQLAKDATAAHV